LYQYTLRIRNHSLSSCLTRARGPSSRLPGRWGEISKASASARCMSLKKRHCTILNAMPCDMPCRDWLESLSGVCVRRFGVSERRRLSACASRAKRSSSAPSAALFDHLGDLETAREDGRGDTNALGAPTPLGLASAMVRSRRDPHWDCPARACRSRPRRPRGAERRLRAPFVRRRALLRERDYLLGLPESETKDIAHDVHEPLPERETNRARESGPEIWPLRTREPRLGRDISPGSLNGWRSACRVAAQWSSQRGSIPSVLHSKARGQAPCPESLASRVSSSQASRCS
jgi:hypothetical protein